MVESGCRCGCVCIVGMSWMRRLWGSGSIGGSTASPRSRDFRGGGGRRIKERWMSKLMTPKMWGNIVDLIMWIALIAAGTIVYIVLW